MVPSLRRDGDCGQVSEAALSLAILPEPIERVSRALTILAKRDGWLH